MKILCVLIVILSVVSCEETDEDFIPTKEWKIIRDGQKIPPGLHVRLNLETGLREAKLLETENNDEKSTGVVPVPSETNQEEISRKKLEEAFARLDLSKDDVRTNESHEEEVRRNFRPYDELKKDFQAMNIKVQTDQEILDDLIEKFKEKSNNEDRKTILTDLEFLLHQFDNGVFFAEKNGLNMLLDAFQTTKDDEQVRRLICLTLGAALQGNPKVQEKAMKSGFVKSLIDLISSESDEQTQFRLFYPLSSLLRSFPPAQIEFLENDGVKMILYFFSSNRSTSKLINRAVTLMTDLIVEKEKIDESKKSFYDRIDFGKRLIELGWCSSLSSRLKSLDVDEFESIEKIVEAFVSVKKSCSTDFLFLEKIRNLYDEREKSDESIYGDFLNNIATLLDYHRQRSLDDL